MSVFMYCTVFRMTEFWTNGMLKLCGVSFSQSLEAA